MASAVATIAAKLASAFTPAAANDAFIVALGLLMAALIFVVAAFVYYIAIAIYVGRKTGFRPTTVVVGGRTYTFTERSFFPLIAALGTLIIAAFTQFFASGASTARAVAQLVLMNPKRILSALVVLAVAAAYLASGTLIYPVTTQAYNCEVGPLARTTILPPAATVAFTVSNLLPYQNFVSRFTKTATTSAIARAVISSFQSVAVSLMLGGSALIEFYQAQKVWIAQPTPPGQAAQLLVVAPDFNVTAHLIGDAIYNLRFVTNAACSPLQPYVFEPLFSPFDGEEFAAALNNTINIAYVPITQGVFRPLAQYFANLQGDPGGSFGDLSPVPSLNSTIDVINNAQRNWTRFGDSFIPALLGGINTLLRDVTGVPLPSLPLPSLPDPTPVPTRGPWTLFIGAPIDLILTTAKLTQNLVFQLAFNPSVALVYPDGIAIWKIDLLLDRIVEYSTALTDYTNFVATYLRTLGLNFEAELTTPLSTLPATRSRSLGNYVPLLTQGQLVRNALDYVASLFDRIPCLIVKITKAIDTTLKLLIDIVAGTIYSFMHAAFSGRVASPFEYAQTLYGPPAVTGVSCKVQSTVVFTIPFLEPCADYALADSLCAAPVFNLMSFDYELNGVLPSGWTSASQATLNAIGASCDNNCTATLVHSSDLSTVVDDPSTYENRFDSWLRDLMAPISCQFNFIARLCVGDECPLSPTTVDNIIPYASKLLLLPINLVLHTDKVSTSSYLTEPMCFPITEAPGNLQGIEVELTNAIRRVVNALVPPSKHCLDSSITGVQPSSFVFCCALNVVDGVSGFLADIAKQMLDQFQRVLNAFLPETIGGGGVENYTPPLFTINEDWIDVITDGLACVPAQFIDAEERCTDNLFDFVQVRFQSAISTVLLEGLLFLPRLIVNTINGLLNVVLSPSLSEVENALTSIITPLTLSFGKIVLDFGRFLQCVDNDNAFSSSLILIGSIFITTFNSLVEYIIDIGFVVFQFAVGVVALLQGNASIIIDAAATLTKIVFGLLIAMFGQPLACGTTDALCFVGVGIAPLIDACNDGTGANGNDYNFNYCSPSRRRSIDDSSDCFQFIADFGYANAERVSQQPASNDLEARATECFHRVNDPGELFAIVARQQKAQRIFGDLVASIPTLVTNHWTATSLEIATAAATLRDQQLDVADDLTLPSVSTPLSVDVGLFLRSFRAKLRGDTETAALFGAHYTEQYKPHHNAKRSLANAFPTHKSFIVNMATALLHAQRLTEKPFAWRATKPSAPRGLPTPTHNPSLAPIAVGGAVLFNRLQSAYEETSTRLAQTIRTKLDGATSPRIRTGDSAAVIAAKKYDAGSFAPSSIDYIDSRGHTTLSGWLASGDLVAPLAVNIDPGLLPVIGLPECDEMNQFVCTNCKYADDLILVSELAFNATRTFYTTPGSARGTAGYLVAELERTLSDVLVNPGGNDTYTTEPRSVLFITTRIWSIRWPWQWDRSEFLDILLNTPVPCDLSDPLDDIDIDQSLKDAFTTLFGDLIPFAQQVVCRVTLTPAETATRLYERYLVCDYDEALYGVGDKGIDSIDGPQQLLDGFAAAVVTLAVLGIAIDIIPGTAMTFMMIAPIWMWFGTFWFGYGASPFCLTPGPMQMFGAYPVTAPMDAYGLLESVLAPSLPFPIALIDPAERDHYSHVKITNCGCVPPVIDCSVYGFSGIYDNIFYTTGVLFGDSFNSAAAATLGSASDAISESALKFTEAYIAELDADYNSGDVCNRHTFVRSIFGLLQMLISLLASVALVSFLIPFIFSIALITIAVVALVGEVERQVERNYIAEARKQEK